MKSSTFDLGLSQKTFTLLIIQLVYNDIQQIYTTNTKDKTVYDYRNYFSCDEL